MHLVLVIQVVRTASPSFLHGRQFGCQWLKQAAAI